MERCIPGTTLESFIPLQDQKATEICIQLMKKIYRPFAAAEFTEHLSDWLKILYQEHALPKALLKKAQKLADTLLNDSDENVVLHGDLHHGNILKCHDGYTIIDPKGIIGNRCYDMACFIRNPLKTVLDNPYLIPIRIQQFSHAFDIDILHLKQWCFVHGMISACWKVENNQDPKDVLLFCDLIDSMMRG